LADYKVNEDYKPTDEDLAYRKMMALSRPKFVAPPKSTIQTDSVSKVMSMSDEELKAYQAREFDMSKVYAEPIDWNRIDSDDEYRSRIVGERTLSIDEITRVEGLRRSAKNQLGESKKSIASDEQKERARQAYVCTPPTPLTEVQIEQLTRMDKIKQLDTMPPEVKKKSFFEWLKSFFHKDEEKTRRMIDLFSEEDKRQWESFNKKDEK
jgi:hypothetical protein